MRVTHNLARAARSIGRAFRSGFSRARSGVVGLPEFLRTLTKEWGLPLIRLQHPDAFNTVVAVHFAVSLIQEKVAKIPLRFYTQASKDAEKVYLDPELGGIAGLWADANSEQTGYELMIDIVGSRRLAGVAYLFLDFGEPVQSTVQQLWVLDPSQVRVLRGRGRGIAGYKVRQDLVPREQIIRFPCFDPRFGLAPSSTLDALVQQYEGMHDANRLERRGYEKGGVSPGHFSTDLSLDDDHIERVRKQIAEKTQGMEHAWDPVILPRGLKYERAGLTMKELQINEGQLRSLKDVLLAHKIPPMYAGIAEGSGLNSDVARVAMLMMHDNAVDPECTIISTILNERMLQLGARFGIPLGQRVRCEFDYSGVLALQHVWLEQAEAYTKATGAPVMTRALAMKRLGIDDLDPQQQKEVEKLLQPSTMHPAGEAPAPTAGDTDVPKDPGKEPPAKPARSHSQSRIGPAHTRVDRHQIWVRADRTLRTHERRMERGFRRVFRRQEERTLARLKAQAEGRALLRAVDISNLLEDDDGDVEIIRRILRLIIEQQGDATMVDLETQISDAALELAFNLSARKVRAYIDTNAARAITQTSQTTRDRLRASLADGVQRDETLAELVARVQEVFDGRRKNAQTIARTETAPAFNFATQEAWIQSGEVDGKEWLSAHDDQVRPAHVEADGQVVRLDLPFVVDGEQLDYPGDPAASLENRANCRCQALPVLRERARRDAEIPAAIRERMNGHAPVAGKSLKEWLYA